MRASKWRAALIGDLELIHKLRQTPVIPPDEVRDQNDINNDLTRTFPTESWFLDHLEDLRTILMVYADTTPTIGYAQGMCFIVFVLYYVYYQDCPKHVINDCIFSLHGIMGKIAPLYPRDDEDLDIGRWLDSVSSTIRLKLLYRVPKLAVALRNTMFIKLMIIKTGPAMFANWFSLQDVLLIWDYILKPGMFENFINVFCALMMHNGDIYMNFDTEKILQLTSVKSFYRVSSVVSYAHSLKH